MKKKSKRKTFNEAFMDQYRADYLTSLDMEPKVHVEVDPAYAGAMEATRKIRKRMEDEFKEQDKMVKEFLTKQDVQAKEPPKATSSPELKAMKLSESELSNKSRREEYVPYDVTAEVWDFLDTMGCDLNSSEVLAFADKVSKEIISKGMTGVYSWWNKVRKVNPDILKSLPKVKGFRGDGNYYESLKDSSSLNEDYSNFIGRPLKDFLNNIDSRTELSVDFENRDSTSGHSGFLGMAHQLPWYTADKIVKDIKLGDERYYKFKVITESKTLNKSLKESENTFSIKDQVQRYIVKEIGEEINNITANEIASNISGYDIGWCPADATPLSIQLRNQINYHILVIAGALTKILFEEAPEQIRESNEAKRKLNEWIFTLTTNNVDDYIDSNVPLEDLGMMAWKWMSNDDLVDMLRANEYGFEEEDEEEDDFNESLNEANKSNKLPKDKKVAYKIVASDADDEILSLKKVNGYNNLIKNLDILKNDLPVGSTQIYVTRDDDKEVYSAFVNDDGSIDVLEDNLVMEMDDGDRPSLLNKVLSDLGTESAADAKALREVDRKGKGHVGFDEEEIGFLDDVFHLNSRNMKQINWAKEVADHYGFKYSEVNTKIRDGEERYYIDIYAPGISDDPLLG